MYGTIGAFVVRTNKRGVNASSGGYARCNYFISRKSHWQHDTIRQKTQNVP